MANTPLHTVVELPEFVKRSGTRMSDTERIAFIDFIAANPTAGEIMEGTGGARKPRWAGGGKGKSGGVRVITFYSGPAVPVFLLTVFGKSEKSNLSKAERNELRGILTAIVENYRTGEARHDQSRRKHPTRRS